MMRSPSVVVKTFTDRYPLVGPTIWILCVQYYAIQYIVGKAWTTHYSLKHNAISDLGNTACGLFSDRYVCSPLHGLMNASFILLGVTMAIGALLIYQEFKESLASLIGFSFMSIAGFGTLLVGIFPENVLPSAHVIGAGLAFLIGNLGLVILGRWLRIPMAFHIYTIFSGILALTALVLLVTNHDLGLGGGGMERLTNYPQTTWLIVFGIYISSNHIRKSVLSAKKT
jgi:hypothetical membrane protein